MHGDEVEISFGLLRSFMNDSLARRYDREQLMMLLDVAQRRDPEHYANQWLPYMRSFAHHFEVCFVTYHSFEEIARAATLLPMAKFALELTSIPDTNMLIEWDRRSGLEVIERLDLTGCGLRGAGLASLAAVRSFERLTELSLRANNLVPEDLQTLMGASWLGQLATLDLSNNSFMLSHAHVLSNVLFERGDFEDSRALGLDDTKRVDPGLEAFVRGHEAFDGIDVIF